MVKRVKRAKRKDASEDELEELRDALRAIDRALDDGEVCKSCADILRRMIPSHLLW